MTEIVSASLSKASAEPGEEVVLTARIKAGSEGVPVVVAAGTASKSLRLEVNQPAPLTWVAVRLPSGAVLKIDATDPTATSNPLGAAYPGFRGPNQLILLTKDHPPRNQWGRELAVDVTDTVIGAGVAVARPTGGYILSGHGTAAAALGSVAVNSRVQLLTEIPGPTPPAPDGPYPRVMVSVYKKIFNQDLPITVMPARAGEIRISSARNTPLTLAGGTSAGTAAMVAALASRRKAGQRSVLSLGGEGGNVSTTNRTQFLDGIARINDTMAGADGGGLDGFDWNIEIGASFPTADALAISTRLKDLHGERFAICMPPNGNNVVAYLAAAVEMHRAGCLDNYGNQLYDNAGAVNYGAVAFRVGEAINRGIPASKISVGMALTSRVAGGAWSQASALDALRRVRAEFGVTKAYLWVEDPTFSNGQAAIWVDNALAAFA